MYLQVAGYSVYTLPPALPPLLVLHAAYHILPCSPCNMQHSSSKCCNSSSDTSKLMTLSIWLVPSCTCIFVCACVHVCDHAHSSSATCHNLLSLSLSLLLSLSPSLSLYFLQMLTDALQCHFHALSASGLAQIDVFELVAIVIVVVVVSIIVIVVVAIAVLHSNAVNSLDKFCFYCTFCLCNFCAWLQHLHIIDRRSLPQKQTNWQRHN